MGFYDLNKEQRRELVAKINTNILEDIEKNTDNFLTAYFSDEDTYIRKTAYLALGKIWKSNIALQSCILQLLDKRFQSSDEKVRQTTIYAAGEIGIYTFESVESFLESGLFDDHHIVRNAVIGSLKKMGAKNPKPILQWAQKYLQHTDTEIRREICHGIELRGRTHPQDILPLLQELQFDKTARVKTTLVHVLGQIAYKKGCLATVIEHLNAWENQEIVLQAIDEIIDVHHRYKNFATLTQEQAIAYIDQHYKPHFTSVIKQ